MKVNCEDCVGQSTLIPLSHQERRRLIGYGLERYGSDKTISGCREEPDVTIVEGGYLKAAKSYCLSIGNEPSNK